MKIKKFAGANSIFSIYFQKSLSKSLSKSELANSAQSITPPILSNKSKTSNHIYK